MTCSASRYLPCSNGKKKLQQLILMGEQRAECEGAFLTCTCDPGVKYAHACTSRKKEHGVLVLLNWFVNF